MDREEHEQIVVEMFRQDRLREAAEAIVAFEARQERPRGLGVPWRSEGYAERFAVELEMVAEDWPAILGEQPDEVRAAIRLRALISAGLGDERLSRRLGIPAPRVGNMDADVAARMPLFHVRHVNEVANWAAIGILEATIAPASDCCPACDRLRGRYRLETLPSLPHIGCTGQYGCRCMASPVFEGE